MLPGTATSSAGNSPITAHFPWLDHQARAAQFAVSLSQQISQLPQQPSSLPPSFVEGFVRKCFPYELPLVDFPHALAALDYMKDLEMRRRRELCQSLRNLGITEDAFENKNVVETTAITEEVSQRDPRIAEWIAKLEEKERKIDSLYTQCYIAIRRWIMINEMSLMPFNKTNCVAMLNTLYPPVMIASPTRKLNEKILMTQREGFFKYIQTVEKRGVSVLKNLMNQGRREDEENGWPATHRFVLQYLNAAISIIKECEDINLVEYDTRPHVPVKDVPSVSADRPLTTAESMDEIAKRNGRKTDSGVSFNSHDSKQHTKTASTSSIKSFTPPSIVQPTAPLGKGGSTLERIARELRKIRVNARPRLDVQEIVDSSKKLTVDENMVTPTTPLSPRNQRSLSSGLRKMKSLGTLGELKHSNASAASFRTTSTSATAATAPSPTTQATAAVPDFDAEEMKRQREAYERSRVGAAV